MWSDGVLIVGLSWLMLTWMGTLIFEDTCCSQHQHYTNVIQARDAQADAPPKLRRWFGTLEQQYALL